MRKLLLLLSCCNVLLYASAQLKAEQALDKLNKEFPQEKVFLMFNKEHFIAGETIHFKSYVFSGYQLSTLSTNLYVELYTANRKLIDKRIIPLGEGIGEGSFVLPTNLPENIYYIRAYTKWMLNFDPVFQYLKSIPVYNLTSPERLALKPTQWTAVAFPESGNLIAGTGNKVAVRLFGNLSATAKWRASVVESNSNNSIIQFNSYNSEVGLFEFVPKENTRYEVLVTDALGNSKKILLRASQNSGAV